jgi:tRNA(Ile)-lysidine synthase
MINLIEDTILQYNMVEMGDTVIVALSGGADSVCLLHNFNAIKEKYNLKLMACHINHHLRGDESNRDMKFCQELCRQNDIEIFIKEADIEALSKDNAISHEECGRKVRYEFFSQLSEKYSAKIATAHNADDNVETVVYNLARGTSLKGLCGIPKVRGNIIRPLIFATRDDIENYCKGYSLVYVTDSTNLTDEYTRNKIRHNVVPILKGINSSVEKTILNMNSTISEISEYLEKSGNLLLKIADNGNDSYLSNKLMEANSVILKEAVAILFARHGFTSYSKKHIDETLAIIEFGGKINLKRDLCAVNKQGFFRIVEQESSKFFSKDVAQNNTYVYKNKKIEFRNVKITRKFNKYASINFINNDIMTKNLKLRNRIAGDTIKLSRRGITKSLKKLMNELKIPEEKRDDILVLADGNEVHWIEGVAVSEQAQVRDFDKDITEIVIKEGYKYDK